MEMALAVQISLILWPLLFLYSPTVSQQKSCDPPKCGNFSIPFPFGMKSEYISSMNDSCSVYNTSSYLNEWFEIECRANQTPFLKSLGLQVTKIDIEKNEVTLKHPIYRCKRANATDPFDYQTISSTVNLDGSPFVYSQKNRFITFGCNIFATLWSNSSGNSACYSSCENKDDMSANDGCFGKSCCQTTPPLYLSKFNISIERVTWRSFQNKSYYPPQLCYFALIADQTWLDKNSWKENNVKNVLGSLKPSKVVVPVVLSWWIPNSSNLSFPENQHNLNCSRVNVTSRTLDTAFSGWNRHCRWPPFRGNPYVRGGCTEVRIDRTQTRGEHKQAHKAIIIIGVFSSLGSISLLIGVGWLYKIIKKRKMKKLKEKYFRQNGGLWLQQKLSSSELNVDTIKLFSSKDLEKATDHFNVDRVLGKGGQGTVYKGMLVDGKIVAVKKLKVQGNVEEFINEIAILTQINHRNVVKLLGCCLETEFPLLVYEFIPNGTLYDHIREQNDELPMTWDMRLRIATEIAGALFYLHSAASQPIYHRDIKSTNILLDEKYRAKVADFGASRMVSNVEDTHLTTKVQGTLGYLDPEYYYTSQLTEKSDVYSFGVVLIELLTGEKAISLIGPDGKAKSLASHFITCLEKNCLFDALEDRVLKEGEKEHIMIVANLAKRCLNMSGKERPTMREVTMELEGIHNLVRGGSKHQERDEIKTGKADINVPWNVQCSFSVDSVLVGMASSSSEVLPLMHE